MTRDGVTDDGLRAALARRSERAVPTAACPEPSVLWDLAAGDLEAAPARAVAAHAVGCPACREALHLAREAGAALSTTGTASGAAPRSRTPWLAAAAILLVAAGTLLYVRRAERPAPPDFRDQETVRIEALGPIGPVPGGAETVLRWTPVEGARYDLTLAREDLEVLSVVRGIAAAEYTVPGDLLHRLPPGERLLWQVEAILADGRKIRSGTFSVRFE
jgi:hypothetical protein